MKNVDILNLQEVGPFDVDLVNFIVDTYLNKIKRLNFGLDLAQGSGGT